MMSDVTVGVRNLEARPRALVAWGGALLWLSACSVVTNPAGGEGGRGGSGFDAAGESGSPGSNAASGGGSAGSKAGEGGGSDSGVAGAGDTSATSSDISTASGNGWLDALNAALGIQGSVWLETDPFVTQNIQVTVTDSKVCLKGSTQVDVKCQPADGSDCFDMYFGARLGVDVTHAINGEVLPHDLAGVTGFQFDMTGAQTGAVFFGEQVSEIPPSLRTLNPVDISTIAGQMQSYYCKRLPGPGTIAVGLGDLSVPCHKSGALPWQPEATKARSLVWWVRSFYEKLTPFDVCISRVLVLKK